MTADNLAWHFLPDDGRLQYGSRKQVAVGQALTVTGPLQLCRRGLHFSRRPIDALTYAPGALVCRVRIGGEVLEPAGEDKGCCTERTVVWMADATHALHEFACWCAYSVLVRERAAGREPDPRSWAAIAAKRAWLRGEIDNRQLAAARDAAWATAWNVDWATAWNVDWATAWNVDWAADAARAAAAAAARAADAARAAAAARAADAARAAAWGAHDAELERRLLALAPAA